MQRVLRAVAVLIVMACCATHVHAQLSIRFSLDTMRFGDIGPCLGARDSFDLINTGTRIVPSPGSYVMPGFRVDAENDNNILPGESRKMYVTFIGNAVVQTYTSRYLLNVTIQGESSSDTLWVLARRLAGRCCVFRVDTIRGYAGENVEIRLLQDSTSAGVFLSDVTSTMNVRFDPTTVVPTGTSPQVIDRKIGEVTFSVRLRNDNGVLASIPARLTLGTSISSEARIAWHSNSDIRVIDTTYAGPVDLLGVCTDDRNRLFDPLASVPRIWIWQGALYVEAFTSTSVPVEVFDVNGRSVLSIHAAAHGITSAQLDRGVYIVRYGDRTKSVISQ